jgi:hypothetical protein
MDMTEEEVVREEAALKKSLEEKRAIYVQSLRDKRNNLLMQSDFTQVADSPLDNTSKAEWATYRQALRDITAHANWPDLEEADWPTAP